MKNEQCQYYPCHSVIQDCDFCFCPLYLYANCGGNYTVLNSNIKDCSKCLLPHGEGRQYILEFLKKNKSTRYLIINKNKKYKLGYLK